MACAKVWSPVSSAYAAPLRPSQISFLPSNAGAVSQNSSLLQRSWVSVKGTSLFHLGFSGFSGWFLPKATKNRLCSLTFNLIIEYPIDQSLLWIELNISILLVQKLVTGWGGWFGVTTTCSLFMVRYKFYFYLMRMNQTDCYIVACLHLHVLKQKCQAEDTFHSIGTVVCGNQNLGSKPQPQV